MNYRNLLKNPFIIAFSYVLLMIIGLETILLKYYVPFSILLTSIFFVVSYYYYNQKIYLENKEKLLMPGEWITEINRNTETINKNSEVLEAQYVSVEKFQRTFLEFKDLLASKENEIKRYREGYDQKIYKKFLLNFIKISNRLEKCQEKDGEDLKKSIKNLTILMEVALEECGIEQIPEDLIIGKHFTELGGLVRDNPSIKSTKNKEENGIVSSIEEPGFKLSDTEKEIIISPSKVTVMQFNE